MPTIANSIKPSNNRTALHHRHTFKVSKSGVSNSIHMQQAFKTQPDSRRVPSFLKLRTYLRIKVLRQRSSGSDRDKPYKAIITREE